MLRCLILLVAVDQEESSSLFAEHSCTQVIQNSSTLDNDSDGGGGGGGGGGPLVIVFWHSAKTDGTTIRSFFGQHLKLQQVTKLQMRLALKSGDFDRASRTIQHHLQSGNGILFVVLHGQGLEPDRWAEELKLWRREITTSTTTDDPKRATTRTGRLFAFTLWRHPVDHATSYYHYVANH
jgi:hypothetical protein